LRPGHGRDLGLARVRPRPCARLPRGRPHVAQTPQHRGAVPTVRPWVKRPVDLLEHDAIIGIEPEVRWLFSCVFDRAARLPRAMLGFLLDASGSPAGVRTIARWSSLPRSTTQRYLLELQTAGLVELDILG